MTYSDAYPIHAIRPFAVSALVWLAAASSPSHAASTMFDFVQNGPLLPAPSSIKAKTSDAKPKAGATARVAPSTPARAVVASTRTSRAAANAIQRRLARPQSVAGAKASPAGSVQVAALSAPEPAASVADSATKSEPADLRTPPGRFPVYCVRLCDGGFFPVERAASVSPGHACVALCPNAKTKLFSGTQIDSAVAADGDRYKDLATAFVYRKRLVPGCTCNGQDIFGTAPVAIASDRTLKSGDLVSTDGGLIKFDGTREGLRSIGLSDASSTSRGSSSVEQRVATGDAPPPDQSALKDD